MFELEITDSSFSPRSGALNLTNYHKEKVIIFLCSPYWFNYFADTYYLKLMAVWDSIIEIINHFYSYDFIIDFRLRNNVLKKLKSDNPALHLIFTELQTDPIYVDAQKYRTAAAHGTSAGEISNTVSIDRDVETEVPVLDESGKLIMKKIKASAVVSLGIGEYTMTKDIDANMEQFATLTGNKIQEIAACMTAAT